MNKGFRFICVNSKCKWNNKIVWRNPDMLDDGPHCLKCYESLKRYVLNKEK